MGVSGAGKTVVGKLLARRLGWEFHDADSFHPPANIAKMSQGIPLNDDDRRPWLESLAEAIKSWLAGSRNAVLACSALKASYQEVLLVDPEQVKLVYLKGSFQLIMERVSAREDHFMPPQLLASQFDTLEEPRNAIVADIDKSPEKIVEGVIAALGRLSSQKWDPRF
jgi:gluconokinase